MVLGCGATKNSMRNFCELIPTDVPVSLGLEKEDILGDSMEDRLGADDGDINGKEED